MPNNEMTAEELLDALVEDSVEVFSDTNITQLRDYAFQHNTDLESVILSNCETIGGYAFMDSSVSLDLNSDVTFSPYALRNFKIKELFLRGQTLPTVKGNGIDGYVKEGLCNIYVTDDMKSTYKNASSWSSISDRIFGISEYPQQLSGSITDSWSEILAAENDGTYSTKYSVGDTKMLNIGDDRFLMQIVAFDADVLSDNTGNAKITWICKGSHLTHSMNDTATNEGGWASSGMRAWLNSDILPLINAALPQNAIKQVEKTYYVYRPSSIKGTQTSSDYIWIPSGREIGTSTNDTSGVQYSSIFTNATTRKKTNTFTSAVVNWWLRTTVNTSVSSQTNDFLIVSTSGGSGSATPTINNMVVFGFCT